SARSRWNFVSFPYRDSIRFWTSGNSSKARGSPAVREKPAPITKILNPGCVAAIAHLRPVKNPDPFSLRRFSCAPRWGVPLCGCQWIFCLRWAVQRPVPEHGEQDIAAPTSERDEGLVMTFALADFARVVSPGDRVAQRCEGRQEQRALELLVSSPQIGRAAW